MGVVATFNDALFQGRYGEFQHIDPALIASIWASEATLYHSNDGSGPVDDVGQQLVLLNMVTAHILALNFGTYNRHTQTYEPASPVVGRVADAGEGSVHVAVQNEYPEGSAQWWQQTKYGSAYWTATSTYRRFRYIADPQPPVDPWWSGW